MRRQKKREQKTTDKIKAGKVERLPPTAEAARDEGPRLLPLEDPVSESSRLEHYLDLADVALGLRGQNHSPESRRLQRNPK
jgi:hypothetical protein